MEAQRFPDDYDGIIVGAPANFWTHHFAGFVLNEQATLNDPASYIPASKLPAIQAAVLDACDALDGIVDGIIDDPRQCPFDPTVLLCQGADADNCLTAPQLTAFEQILDGPRNPRTGEQIFPGYMPGAAAAPPGDWSVWITGAAPGDALQFFFGDQFFSNMVFEDPNWDFRTLNFDSDVAFADHKMAGIINSTNPDLNLLRARGGKIILITDPRGAREAGIETLATLILPEMASTVAPLVYAIPVQLIAYHTAVVMGTDVDQPRNLAKSVTVE